MPGKYIKPFHLIEINNQQPERNYNSRYNAFTAKAYAKHSIKHDIGKPPKVWCNRVLNYNSKFKKQFIDGQLPFEIDHSKQSNKITRLAWKQSIQNIDLKELLPLVIYGLADSNSKYADLAELTLKYILDHAHKQQIYDSLCHLVIAFRFIFRTNNKYAITIGIQVLSQLVSSLYYSSRILIPEYKNIMLPLAKYMTQPEEKLCDDIFYGQWHNNYLSTTIEHALRTLEAQGNGALEQYAAFIEIKKALPVYESEVFPLKSNKKQSMVKEFNEKSTESRIKKRLTTFRIIDINTM